MADVADSSTRGALARSASVWNDVGTLGHVAASSVLADDLADTHRPVQGQVQTVFANQARVQDAVLTEPFAAHSSTEGSWALGPASTLKSLTNAVDNVLTTYNDDTFDE